MKKKQIKAIHFGAYTPAPKSNRGPPTGKFVVWSVPPKARKSRQIEPATKKYENFVLKHVLIISIIPKIINYFSI